MMIREKIKTFRLGCAEEALEVPLFVELYGYGPFIGRRNLGAHDPLYCRAFYFDDGRNRAMFITADEYFQRQFPLGRSAAMAVSSAERRLQSGRCGLAVL